MLTLTRKEGESILVGDDIEIVITEARNNRVKLAVSAPPHVAIIRKELVGRTPGRPPKSTE